MSEKEFRLRVGEDSRFAAHAASALPAWLWSIDGARLLWANAAGLALFGADANTLSETIFGPADVHRRQVAQLARSLPSSGAIRMERLRGFGAPLGRLVTCGCARLDFADGSHGVLIAAAEPLLQRPRRPAATPVEPAEPASPLRPEEPIAPVALGDQDLQPVENEDLMGSPPPPEAIIPLAAALDQTSHQGEAEPEPPPLIEAVADEPPLEASPPPENAAERPEATGETASSASGPTLGWFDEPPPHQLRRHPLRFMWQMDAEGRFSLGSDEFTRLIGIRTAAGFGRLWSEIADLFDLDPSGQVAKAVATRNTWSGITLNWPVDGDGRLPVELSGLPIFDRQRVFAGYRGFGVCRDLDGLARLEALRRYEFFSAPSTPSPAETDQSAQTDDVTEKASGAPDTLPSVAPEKADETPAPPVSAEQPEGPTATSPAKSETQADLETPVEPPANVVPFRPGTDPKFLTLTPVESNAFDELARQLSARLGEQNASEPAESEPVDLMPAALAPADLAPADLAPADLASAAAAPETVATEPEPEAETGEPIDLAEPPGWLTEPPRPASGEAQRDRLLLDLLPTGVLIYRLDRLLYANPAFLSRLGWHSLHELEQAGGLDALYVEPGVSSTASTSGSGTAVRISAPRPSTEAAPSSFVAAHLHTISWNGESALALVLSGVEESPSNPVTQSNEPPPPQPVAGRADAEELGAILDTAAEGVVMFDAEGNIHSCNRSAEALFGTSGDELVKQNLAALFAPESQPVVLDYLEGIKRDAGLAGLLDHGREVLGSVRGKGVIPLSVIMGRTRPNSANFFAVFRDLSQVRKSEGELQQARRLAENAANAKADMLSRLSHEIRAPLNAIIGFAEVMIGERFGALGNERYLEYLKDIRASGQRVIAIIDGLLDLSRIETGQLDLTFAPQNLNELVEQCVAVMQPQANRERIIIRTSLAHSLPPVTADAHALRQITLNLIGNSIHLANPGGQVIVSTALSDGGEVMLRVRDTGHGLNEREVAAAMEPFKSHGPADQAPDSPGISLSLTKALAEANHAGFAIRTGPSAGTLIEVTFNRQLART